MGVNMTASIVKIPKDKLSRHLITIPKEIWEIENLKEGDFIKIDINKIILGGLK